MGKFNRDDRGGSRGFGGGGRSFGGGDRGGDSRRGGGFGGRGNFGDRQQEMHKAVCGECGKDCEVPFRPTGDRPVFCSNCFKNVRPEGAPRSNDRGGFSKPSFSDRAPSAPAANNRQLEEKLEAISTKLSKILDLLHQTSPVSAPAAKKAVEIEKPLKVAKAAKAVKKEDKKAVKKGVKRAAKK